MDSAARVLETMTMEDYEALPEERRVEIIRGIVYDMSAPTVRHQQILGDLFLSIGGFLKSKQARCRVFPAPFDVKLKNKPLTIVQPDIVVVCDPKKLENGKRCEGAPDWVIEIVSPSHREHDFLTKLNLYQEAGVREYWIVDPEQEKVFVYSMGADAFKMWCYAFGEEIPTGLYDDLILTVE